MLVRIKKQYLKEHLPSCSELNYSEQFKHRKNPNYPRTDGCLGEMWFVYKTGCNSALKNKKGHFDICDTDLWWHNAKWNKPVGKDNTNSTYTSHLISQNHGKQKASRQGTGGKRTRELLFNGYRTSFLQDEKRREIGGNVSPIILWMFLIPLNYTPQNGFNDTWISYSLQVIHLKLKIKL